MIKMYFSDISGLIPWFLAHSSQNPWNFQGLRVTHCYVNEMAFGLYLRLGASCQGSQLGD